MTDNDLALGESSGENKVLSFFPSAFILAALPLRDVKRSNFRRSYNGCELIISNTSKVPFGSYGRNILSVLTTHAVLHGGSGGLNVSYSSVSDLCSELGVPRQRSQKVIEQISCFSDATFVFKSLRSERVSGGVGEDGFSAVRRNMFATGMIPFCDAVIWDEYEDEKGKKRAKSFCVRLSAQFVSYAKEHCVPIDFSVYTQIQSPVCKDLYVWCCYRANIIREDKLLYISRKNMVGQFMPVKDGDLKAESDNWSVIMSHLREIRDKWYPGLKVEFCSDNGGIYFYNSPLVIEDNDKRYMMPTSL